jgi:lysophospholipase L1-like esterase
MASSSFHLRPAILLFGDSITQQAFGVNGKVGWGSLLASSYARRADVLERGYFGYSTAHALDILPRVFGEKGSPSSKQEILFCTVLFGSNDAVFPGTTGQHVPVKQYGENIASIVAGIRERVESSAVEEFPIILLTPPPVDEVAWKTFKNLTTSNRTNQRARIYGDQVKQVASDLHCPVIDTWELLEGNSEERSKYLTDGLHLKENGNRLVYQAVMDLVRNQYPHLAPMADDDGEGKYGSSGIPVEENLWGELC